MNLLIPELLYLLLLLPLFALWQRRLRRRDAIPYPSLDLLEDISISWRQRLLFLPPLCLYLSLACLIVCLARPQKEVTGQTQEREGIAIEMLIDVSTSMDFNIDYGDESLSRMEVSKKVVEQFVAGDGKELTGRDGDLIGVVSFSRYADTICPMTLSHDALVQIVRDMDVNERPNEDGTNYGDAIALAAARLESLESNDEETVKSKVIVLLTDGENNTGSRQPLAAAALAKEWGIRIYTVSLQEKQALKRKKTKLGEFLVPAVSSPSDQVLQTIAKESGGIFRAAYDFNSLAAVYKEINRLEKSKMKTLTYSDFENDFTYWAVAPLILLLLQQLLQSTILRVSP